MNELYSFLKKVLINKAIIPIVLSGFFCILGCPKSGFLSIYMNFMNMKKRSTLY